MQEITTTPESSTSTAPVIRLSPADTAERLSVATQTLARWRHVGVGPPYLKIAGKVFYFSSDVDAFIQSCRVVPTRRTKTRTAKKRPRKTKGVQR
jgi:predicted site-specific integrase-resolvase